MTVSEPSVRTVYFMNPLNVRHTPVLALRHLAFLLRMMARRGQSVHRISNTVMPPAHLMGC